ncbi:nicotinate phosphoribosyltransferase [Rhinoraja longicauda]
MSELAAFISYAAASPNNFVGLVDTYSVVRSGVPNFCAVSLALNELGYRAQGVRVDSGDLLRLSLTLRTTLQQCAHRFGVSWLSHVPIIITNGITEKHLLDLQRLPNAVDAVGVGTNLVTCPLQPSLGCIYKLTQVGGKPRIKLTEDQDKMTLPGKKTAYRLFGEDDSPMLDLLTMDGEVVPRVGEVIWCHGLSGSGEQVSVTAARIECLHHVYYRDGQITRNLPTTAEIRSHAQRSLSNLPPKHKYLQEPVPYQVAISTRLQRVLRELMEEGAPASPPSL